MSDPKAAIIVGASSGVGRALAEEFSAGGYDLVLLARGERDLSALSNHLMLRYKNRVFFVPWDLNSQQDYGALSQACLRMSRGRVEALLFPAGQISDRDEGIPEANCLNDLAQVNFLSIAQLLGHFLRALKDQGQAATAVVFSSIAVSAPRKKNIAYGASKAALEYYCKGLQHWFNDKNIKIQIYALGYVDTGMAFGKKLRLPAVSAESVAKEVFKNLKTNKRLIYYPRYWAWVTMVLRKMPWVVYKKLSF